MLQRYYHLEKGNWHWLKHYFFRILVTTERNIMHQQNKLYSQKVKRIIKLQLTWVARDVHQCSFIFENIDIFQWPVVSSVTVHADVVLHRFFQRMVQEWYCSEIKQVLQITISGGISYYMLQYIFSLVFFLKTIIARKSIFRICFTQIV